MQSKILKVFEIIVMSLCVIALATSTVSTYESGVVNIGKGGSVIKIYELDNYFLFYSHIIFYCLLIGFIISWIILTIYRLWRMTVVGAGIEK